MAKNVSTDGLGCHGSAGIKSRCVEAFAPPMDECESPVPASLAAARRENGGLLLIARLKQIMDLYTHGIKSCVRYGKL